MLRTASAQISERPFAPRSWRQELLRYGALQSAGAMVSSLVWPLLWPSVMREAIERLTSERSARHPARTPRIAVLSDRGLCRDGLVEMLGGHGFRHVAAFASSASLLRASRDAGLDLTLVVLAHEREDPEEVMHRLRALWPEVTVVAIGTPLQLAARAPNADGCIELPGDGATRLFAMAGAVSRRHRRSLEFPVSPELARQRRIWAALTPRQREVLGLLGCGADNLKIAGSLGISERAVKGHVSALLEKFGADNRTALALVACGAGVRSDLAS